MSTPRYEAADPYAWPASMRRSLDAAMAKGRLVSTRDALAKADEALRLWEQKGPTSLVVALVAEALYGIRSAVIDVATLADDEALARRVATGVLSSSPTWEDVEIAGQLLENLAAALTEPRP